MKWLIALIAVEAITEILVESPLFERARCWIGAKHELLDEFVQCGWCISVWVGGLVFALILLRLEIVLVPFALARTANFLHDLFGVIQKAKWRDK